MEYRILGKTGLQVSAIGFGCGAVGGIMTADDYPERIRCVSRALDAGINYFDTAQIYGGGRSEENLGRVLADLRPDVVVGTKVQITPAQMNHIEEAVIQAAETSLRRLRRERLDVFQLHNPLSLERRPEKAWVGAADLEPAVQAFQKLQTSGKIRFWGINGIGETDAVHQVITQRETHTIQACFNLLNPSACCAVPQNFPFQNYQVLAKRAALRGVGVIAFRILAGGALSAVQDRHPIAAKSVDPIASSGDYADDVALAARFAFLVSEDWVDTMVEAAVRFALSQPVISTIPIGFSGLDQLDQAVTAAEKGPLPPEVLDRLPEIWQKL